MNNVTDKDVAILLVEINHKGLGLGTIVEFVATVTELTVLRLYNHVPSS